MMELKKKQFVVDFIQRKINREKKRLSMGRQIIVISIRMIFFDRQCQASINESTIIFISLIQRNNDKNKLETTTTKKDQQDVHCIDVQDYMCYIVISSKSINKLKEVQLSQIMIMV